MVRLSYLDSLAQNKNSQTLYIYRSFMKEASKMIRPGSRTNQLIAQMDHIPCQEQHLATQVFIISRPHKFSIDMRDLSLNYTVPSIVYLN